MDPEMASAVIGQTDTMQNEPMNFRVGAELVRKMRTLLPEELLLDPDGKKYIPFFEQALYSVPAEDFLKNELSKIYPEVQFVVYDTSEGGNRKIVIGKE
jgi:hypothetical protein